MADREEAPRQDMTNLLAHSFWEGERAGQPDWRPGLIVAKWIQGAVHFLISAGRPQRSNRMSRSNFNPLAGLYSRP